MDRVVAEAARLARPGDTVLLAPAGASFDMFAGYGARGDAFAAAVRRLAQGANTPPRTGADRATGPDRPGRPDGPADPTRPG
jgi:UDP-N-acetylmuramoylalanine--D-glutamate ligase